MKVVIIIGIVLVVILALIQAFAFSTRVGIEEYPYKVEKKYKDFEIRNYEASLFTSVKLSTNRYEQASSQGFSVLASYIFGGNDKKEKISMTSPVSLSLEDSMTMMFLVPKKMKKEDLPKPDKENINFVEVPAKRVAALRFGGWANTKKIEKYKQELITALEVQGIAFTNKFYFLGYNPPFDFIGRKNEIIVELE